MAEKKLGFIYGQMKASLKFTSTQRRITKPQLPPRTPKQHRKFLLETLDIVERKLKQKAERKVEGATSSLVAVKYAEGSEIKLESLESKKDGVRVVYDIPEKHQVLLDVSQNELKELRKKISDYGEKTRVSPLSKDKTPKPANNSLVAPIEKIEEAKFKLIWGLSLQKHGDKMARERTDWFELSCRGGVHDETGETARSRSEILAALVSLGLNEMQVPEYVAPERILFFVECSLEQAKQLFELTDCIFEIELVPPSTLNWLLTDRAEIPFSSLPSGAAPGNDAPSAVILDSGVNSKHPLIAKAVALEGSVHPEDPSPVDIVGHGTQLSGVNLFGQDVAGVAAGRLSANSSHWIESIRVFTHRGSAIHSASGRPFWAKMTDDAIKLSDAKGRPHKQKAFCLAVTAEQAFPGSATSWSLAVDQLAYNRGEGRVICVSVGNARSCSKSFCDSFPQENHLHKLEDPSQAFNVISVGAYTDLSSLPPEAKYSTYKALAASGGVSPHTRSGQVVDFVLPIKPDVVFEGGNIAFNSSYFYDEYVPTLTAATTGHELKKPLVTTNGTSLAVSLATKFALDIWKVAPKLRPETVRGLVVHSATWTREMLSCFNGNINDMLALCGYGVPSSELASYCTRDRATVIVEGEMANLNPKPKGSGGERQMQLFELPLPEKLLVDAQNKQVELRVTLSYFAEPNSARGLSTRGMDLAWDIQGPAEGVELFQKRINKAMREEDEGGPGTRSFKWDIGPRRRTRGTVQSDRWRGNAADLAGSRLIAVYPKYGWWNQRKKLQFSKTRFSLIITAITPDLEIYNHVKQGVEVPVKQTVQIKGG